MASYREDLGQAVREVMDRPGRELSTREVSRRSGGRVSTSTVLSLRDGKVVGPELIVEFAKATGADPNSLLEKAGIWDLRYVGEPVRVRRSQAVGVRPVAVLGRV